MSAQSRENLHPELGGFLGAVTSADSYLRVVYLLLSMPLGTFYFCLFVVWFCLGLGLSFIAIGIPILGLMFLAARGLGGLERQLANLLLDADIPPGRPIEDAWAHPWRSFKACLTDSFTWKALVFLLLKFPLGLISFVITVVLVALSAELILAPFFYQHAPVIFYRWRVSTPEAALVSLLAGIVIGILTLNITNLLAIVWREFCRVMLVAGHREPAASVKSGPVIIP